MCGHLCDKLTFTVKLFLLGFTPGFYSLSFSAFCAPKTKLKRTRWRWLECWMLRWPVTTREKALLPLAPICTLEDTAVTPAADWDVNRRGHVWPPRCRIFTLAFSQTSASECDQKHSRLSLSAVGGFLVLRLGMMKLQPVTCTALPSRK